MLKKSKRSLLLNLFIVIAISTANAQSVIKDTIVKLNGDRIAVKIVTNNENNVTFSYPGETMISTLSKNLITEIIYSSGRKEKFNEKIVINGEGDWEKVKLTSLTSEIEGLVKKGVLDESTANLGPIYTPGKKALEKLQKKIKQSAAKLGAHVVLLVTPMTDAMKFSLSGVAYGY